MPRRSYRRSRSSGPRRKLVWARINGSQGVNVAVAPALDAPTRNDALLEFEQSLGSSVIGATVVRVRGYASFSDPDATAGVITQCRMTMYVGNNNEIDRGPNTNDNAFDDLSQGKDFFLFEPFLIDNSNVVDSTANYGAPGDLYSRLIDVKSSRKIEELNQTIILEGHAASVNEIGVQSVAWNFDLSLLLMLP